MTPCSFDGCGRPSRALGLCAGHNQQKRRGQALRPLQARSPKGQLQKVVRLDISPELDVRLRLEAFKRGLTARALAEAMLDERLPKNEEPQSNSC